jgi:transcription initiation factor TFIIB
MLTVSKTYFMDKDFRNRIVFDVRWTRLRKYRKDILRTKYVVLEEEVKRLMAQLNLPRSCADNALKLAKQLTGSGYSPQALAAAALFLSCRMLKSPRPISDFAGYVDIERMRKVIRELSALVKNVPRLEYYVAVITARLNIPPSAARTAVELLQKNKKVLQGRNPWAAAAAALWLSGVDISLLKQFASPSAIKNIVPLLK